MIRLLASLVPLVSLSACGGRARPESTALARTGADTLPELFGEGVFSTGAWGEPRHLGAPVSAPGATEWSPSVAANGNLYFGTVRPGGRGANDLYVARRVDGAYAEPESLGDSINTRGGEVEPWIAPDESYLIFSGQNRPGSVGGFDLFVSHRVGGVWQGARPLGAGVDSRGGDFNQSVSPDGRWLYFSSNRGRFDRTPDAPLGYAEMQRRLTGVGNGLGDIYRVEMARPGIPGR